MPHDCCEEANAIAQGTSQLAHQDVQSRQREVHVAVEESKAIVRQCGLVPGGVRGDSPAWRRIQHHAAVASHWSRRGAARRVVQGQFGAVVCNDLQGVVASADVQDAANGLCLRKRHRHPVSACVLRVQSAAGEELAELLQRETATGGAEPAHNVLNQGTARHVVDDGLDGQAQVRAAQSTLLALGFCVIAQQSVGLGESLFLSLAQTNSHLLSRPQPQRGC
mmetsp:Transcript_25072/g.36003  ORF Transcript_25072/g.36003 Transcript_25072/m.36003 type:complete len:222 (+) Transcript_25072:1060-1725(+)